MVPYVIHEKVSGAHGRQKLTDMHYYTFTGFSKLAVEAGLAVVDIRARRIRQEVALWPIVLPLYYILRPFYFDLFHLLARRAT